MKVSRENAITVLISAYVTTLSYVASAYHYVNSVADNRFYVIVFVPIAAVAYSLIILSEKRNKNLSLLAVALTFFLVLINFF